MEFKPILKFWIRQDLEPLTTIFLLLMSSRREGRPQFLR